MRLTCIRVLVCSAKPVTEQRVSVDRYWLKKIKKFPPMWLQLALRTGIICEVQKVQRSSCDKR